MQPTVTGHVCEIVTDRLLLIVAGAHLQAEVTDRPLAYRLREQVLRWIETADPAAAGQASPPGLEPVVCSDLWYLNNEELLERPAISIGGPGVNAATAFLAGRLPRAFVLDETFQVLLDPEFCARWACMWGVDHAATVSAVDLFAERYLDPFLRAHGYPNGC